MSPRSLGASAFLHGFLVLVMLFGLPQILQPDDILYQPQVISVDLAIAPVANAPTRTPTPPKKPEPTPPKPAPAKPEPVKKEEPKPTPQPPAPKPEPVKKEEPKPAEKKTEPKKEEPKKEEPKEPTLDDILKGIEQTAPKQEAKPAPAEKGEAMVSDVPYDPSRPMSQTVRDSIRNQIMKCWNYQGGAKEQGTLVAHMQVVFREDGSIIESRLRPGDIARYNTDPAFRSLVDSARRATKNPECVPLKGLPRDSYTSWSKVELVFDPSDMW